MRRSSVPVAPSGTIGFHGSGGILTDIGTPSPGSSLTINLEAGDRRPVPTAGYYRIEAQGPNGSVG